VSETGRGVKGELKRSQRNRGRGVEGEVKRRDRVEEAKG
jgi:hypothetical protein